MSYIEKEAAIKLLRGECVAKYPNTFAFGLFAAADEIRKMPMADVVEVVRCKDCKWWKRMNGDKRLQCFHGHGLIRTTENDYCSRGERSENGK